MTGVPTRGLSTTLLSVNKAFVNQGSDNFLTYTYVEIVAVPSKTVSIRHRKRSSTGL
jgi:hypothetical protein